MWDPALFPSKIIEELKTNLDSNQNLKSLLGLSLTKNELFRTNAVKINSDELIGRARSPPPPRTTSTKFQVYYIQVQDLTVKVQVYQAILPQVIWAEVHLAY